MKFCALYSRFFAVFTLFLAAILLVACHSDDKTPANEPLTTATAQFNAMNTFMVVKSTGVHPELANDSVQKLIANLERHLSTTIPESDIYRLNHDALADEAGFKTAEVDSNVAELAKFALGMAKETDGALDPVLYPIIHAWGFTTEKYRVPSDSEIAALLPITDYHNVNIEGHKITMKKGMMMDLGAVGKGFAGDKAIALLKDMGVRRALLDLGGNVQVLGCKDSINPWKVGITNPWGGPALGGVAVCDKAVITSGGYERFFMQDGHRYIHIFDARTGHPVENDLAAVTVVADSGLLADALTTSLFVMGREGAIDFWKKNGKTFEMVLVMKDHSIAYTAGLDTIVKWKGKPTRLEKIVKN